MIDIRNNTSEHLAGVSLRLLVACDLFAGYAVASIPPCSSLRAQLPTKEKMGNHNTSGVY